MGEIFRREFAEHPEPFTGERLTSAFGGQVQIEHYHRYLFARSRVAGLDVLDVASGEGYGSALLAQVARSVVGVEYSGPTAASAAANFPRDNLRFLQGDARALPLMDACVDAVVSFETIEHFDRQDDFLREIRRVLRPGGSFIVSTPDRDTYSPTGSPPNPFHVHELSRNEFVALLHTHFRHVLVAQQRPVSGSALLADTASPAPALVFDRRGDSHFEACIGLPRAPYVIAVASDREPLPLPPSIYIDRSDLDTEPQQRMALLQQLRQTQSELDQARHHAEQAAQRADAAEQSAAQATQRAVQSEQHAEAATQQVEAATHHAQQEVQRADQATHRAGQAESHLAALRGEYEALQSEHGRLLNEHAVLQGSARTFLRGYLPRLRRHLLGQRP